MFSLSIIFHLAVVTACFTSPQEISGNVDISWNHVEFEVRYESLLEEIKIGDYYLRLLLEEGGTTTRFDKPLDFFNDLYHRFLLSPKPAMKAMCLQVSLTEVSLFAHWLYANITMNVCEYIRICSMCVVF